MGILPTLEPLFVGRKWRKKEGIERRRGDRPWTDLGHLSHTESGRI